MWEEHPAYQKAQAKMIGLLVAALFVGSAIYSATRHDWDLLRLIIYAGIGLVAALAIFPLTAWIIIKAHRRLRGDRSKSPPHHEA